MVFLDRAIQQLQAEKDGETPLLLLRALSQTVSEYAQQHSLQDVIHTQFGEAPIR